MNTKYPSLPESMYRPEFEHDACGVGFVANISGKKEFRILDYAIQATATSPTAALWMRTPRPATAPAC